MGFLSRRTHYLSCHRSRDITINGGDRTEEHLEKGITSMSLEEGQDWSFEPLVNHQVGPNGTTDSLFT